MYNRPTGVTILAGVLLLGGFWALCAATNYFTWSPYGRIFPESNPGAFAFVYRLVYGVALIVLAMGLWNLKPWARIASILVAGINLFFNIAGAISSIAWGIDWIGAIISVVIIVYLIRGDIAYTFKG